MTPAGSTGRSVFPAALLLGAALLAEALLRPLAGSHDAHQYLDVAANLAEGRGLVQSVPGYNSPRFPVEPTWPQPFTSQPPLYPWLGSVLIRAGIEPAAALTALAVAGVIATWLAGAWLAAALWGVTAGTLALAGLALSAASGAFCTRIWSDPLAIAFALLALAALLRARDDRGIRWAVLAGACAGLAMLDRHVFGILIPFGAGWLLLARRDRRGVRAALVYAVVALALVAPVLARNVSLAGGWFGEPRNPSDLDATELAALAWRYTWGRMPGALRVALGAGGAILLLALVRSRGLRERTRAVAGAGAGLVPLWGLAYLLGLFALRLDIHFDAPGVRLLAPAIVAALLLAAGLFARLLAPPRAWVNAGVTLVLVAASAAVALRVAATPDPRRHEGGRSPFLRWIAEHTPPGGVVVIEDGVDAAWALRGAAAPRIASFSAAPYMQPLAAADLERLVRVASPHPLRVVVRGEAEDATAWRRLYGDAIAGAVTGQGPRAGLVLEHVVQGKRVLRWRGVPADTVARAPRGPGF